MARTHLCDFVTSYQVEIRFRSSSGAGHKMSSFFFSDIQIIFQSKTCKVATNQIICYVSQPKTYFIHFKKVSLSGSFQHRISLRSIRWSIVNYLGLIPPFSECVHCGYLFALQMLILVFALALTQSIFYKFLFFCFCFRLIERCNNSLSTQTYIRYIIFCSFYVSQFWFFFVTNTHSRNQRRIKSMKSKRINRK